MPFHCLPPPPPRGPKKGFSDAAAEEVARKAAAAKRKAALGSGIKDADKKWRLEPYNTAEWKVCGACCLGVWVWVCVAGPDAGRIRVHLAVTPLGMGTGALHGMPVPFKPSSLVRLPCTTCPASPLASLDRPPLFLPFPLHAPPSYPAPMDTYVTHPTNQPRPAVPMPMPICPLRSRGG